MLTFGNACLFVLIVPFSSNDGFVVPSLHFHTSPTGHLLALGGGILWGISTPLMKGQSSHLVSWQQKSEEQQKSFLLHALGVLTSLACSWKVS